MRCPLARRFCTLPRMRLHRQAACLAHADLVWMQIERKTADWQRTVLLLAPLNWAALQQAEAAVTRHAQLWAAWAGLQAAWADWNTRALLDSTGQASQPLPAQRPSGARAVSAYRIGCCRL